MEAMLFVAVLIGVFIGTPLGMLVMSLLVSASRAREQEAKEW